MAVIVLLVMAAGVFAVGVYLGVIASPSDGPVTTPPPCPKPATTTRPLDARRVKVNVYNATGRVGLAASTAAALRTRRFAIGAVSNDPGKAKVPGTALVRYGPKGSAAARLVAAQVPGAKIVDDKRPGTDVDLVLGASFTALGPTAKPAATPKPSAPCASDSPTSATRTGAPKTRPTTTPR